MSSMSDKYSSGCWRIVYSPRWRSISFTHGRFHSWVLFSRRMDPAKAKAVADWPTPDSRRGSSIFCGLHFYRQFIRNFSQVALPLTDLTSTKKQLCWSSKAQTAFESLKSCFISTPILNTLDPSLQFIVEMDASEVGVGAILSYIIFGRENKSLRLFFSSFNPHGMELQHQE